MLHEEICDHRNAESGNRTENQIRASSPQTRENSRGRAFGKSSPYAQQSNWPYGQCKGKTDYKALYEKAHHRMICRVC